MPRKKNEPSVVVSMPPRPQVLITTLGDQPQVVTRALDELLRRGHAISRVTVVHTSEKRSASKRSVESVRAEEARYKGIDFRYLVFQNDGGAELEDIKTLDEAQVVLRTLFRALRLAKHEGAVVHLSIAGGRKVVSAYGVVAAQLLFDDGDFCWHLYEGAPPPSAGQNAACPECKRPFFTPSAMHAAPDEKTILIPVPVLPLPGIAPILAELGSDPWELLDIVKRDQERQREAKLREFLTPAHGVPNRLTKAESETLRLLCQGRTNAEICKSQGIVAKTLSHRIAEIIEKFRMYYEWPKGAPLEDRTLIVLYAPLLAKDEKR